MKKGENFQISIEGFEFIKNIKWGYKQKSDYAFFTVLVALTVAVVFAYGFAVVRAR